MAQPVFGVFYWRPWVLLTRESWFWVFPPYSTARLYWFPYRVFNAVQVKYRKGMYSVTIVTSVPWDVWTSTAFLAVLWAACLSRFFRRNLRCGRRRAIDSFLKHCTNQWTCSSTPWLKKASVEEEKISFSHTASSTQYSFTYLREPRLRE